MSAAVAQRTILVDATMASVHLRRAYGAQVPPATIRQWAARKVIVRHGFGQYRFDLGEIERVAHERGLIAGDARPQANDPGRDRDR